MFFRIQLSLRQQDSERFKGIMEEDDVSSA